MSKWNLIVDVAKCENCHNCTLATKDEYVDNTFPGYSAAQPRHGHEWIRIERRVRGEGSMVDVAYVPMMCNHCDDAPCMKNAGDAIRKRDDGIVIIDPEKARGRWDLVDACPYGNIWWNDEQGVPQSWFFDAHLLDGGWREPRCAQSCPTGALEAVRLSDLQMAARAAQEGLRVQKPELGTRPRIYYRNLDRFDKEFIGGAVVAVIDGVSECVEGAVVTLSKDTSRLATVGTDVFGDFKFDGLVPDSGTYRIEVQHPEYGSATVIVDLQSSVYLDPVAISK